MFYENYLNSLKADQSYIPESASYRDMAIFAERAFQDAYNEAFFSIATQEMAMFESAINEADGDKPAVSTENKKNLLEIIKKAVTTIWEKAKGFYLNAIASVKENFAKFKKEKGDKIKADFKAGVAKLPADFVAKGIYDPKKVKAVYDNATKGAANIGLELQKAFADASKDYTKDDMIKAAGFASADDFNASVANIDKIDAKASDIKSAAGDIANYVFDIGGWLKMIKNTYNKNKGIIDTCMKAAKTVINRKNDKEVNQVAKEFIKLCKDATAVLVKLTAKSNSTLRAVRTNYVGLVAKVVATSKKAVKEDTEITIDVKDDAPEETDVKVDTPAADDVEVKDEVEEAFAGLLEEDDVAADVEVDDAEVAPTEDENEGCKSCKEDVDIEVNVEDSDDDEEVEADVEDVKESALERAIYQYLV